MYIVYFDCDFNFNKLMINSSINIVILNTELKKTTYVLILEEQLFRKKY